MAAPALVVRTARAAYRAFLRIRAGRHGGYTAAMEATFDALLGRAAEAGSGAVIALLVREIVGLAHRGGPDRAGINSPRLEGWKAGSRLLSHIGQDVRFAIRTFRRRPAFTAALVATLALGIGANAAIFSVTKAVLLKRLPFRDPSRLVMVWEDAPAAGFPRNTPAPGSYGDWVTSIRSFEGVAAIDQADFNLTGDGDPEKIGGAFATANLFSVLGVQPVLGRVWRLEEDQPGSHLAVLNYGLWIRRFGADPGVIGRTVDFSGVPYTVIGVMPEHFEFSDPDLEVWAPLGLTAAQLANRGTHYLWVVARLRPGASLVQANAELSTLAERLAREHPDSNRGVGMYAVPVLADYVGDTRSALVILLLAVGCVLLIACVNVANLLMTQAAGRAREMAVRAALGASRRRIARQLLTESVLLALVGGTVGVLVAVPAVNGLERLVPPAMRSLSHVTLDPTVLTATAVLSALTGVLFGVAPAWRASRVELTASTTRLGGRGVVGSGARLRTGLVVAEVALATVLLVGAGLLVQSFRAARGVALGFRSNGVLTLRLQLSRRPYAAPEARTRFVDAVLDRVRALPGIAAAGYASTVPLVWKGGTDGFTAEGEPVNSSLSYDALNRTVSPGYMETMGMTLREGRFFDERDRANGAPVGIINDTMARQYWPGVDPLGRRFRFDSADSPWRTIVGIVGDTPEMGIEQPPKAEMYFPIAQSADNWMWPRDLVIRAPGDSLATLSAVRAAIWSVNRNQPVSNVQTMDAIVAGELQDRQMQTTVFSVFAGLALFLAAVGIYGVLSSAVAERTAEIGLRLALGGDPGVIRRLFVRRGLGVAGLGLAIGVAVAFWGTTLLDRLLFQVGAHDVSTFALQAGILAVVSAVAAYLPARRASQVDPMTALRTE
jgi:putative ABC transport system permease protein